jgi:hypothetical protein
MRSVVDMQYLPCHCCPRLTIGRPAADRAGARPSHRHRSSNRYIFVAPPGDWKATKRFQMLIICKYARNVSPNRELWGYWKFADRRAHRDGWIDRFLLFSILRLAHDLCEPSGFGTRGTIYFITSLSASPPETDVSVELEYSLNSISFSGRCCGGV